MSNIIEMVAQFLTKFIGEPVSNVAVVGGLVVVALSVIVILFGAAWNKSEQRQWDELKQLEEWDD